MDGMGMPTSADMAMTMATATATIASGSSFAFDAAETGAGSTGQSTSMSMQGMASYVHFGIGDPFLASFFTPVHTSGYVAVIFFFVLLGALQRALLAFTEKANHKLPAHVQHPYRAESETKSSSWIVEEVPPAEGLATRLKVWAPHAIAKSLLQVLNAAMGFLVMLGVMTLNAGYILALLVGVFLGEFALSWYKHSHPAAH